MLVQYSVINLSYTLDYYAINLTQQFASVNMRAVSALVRVEEKTPHWSCCSLRLHAYVVN